MRICTIEGCGKKHLAKGYCVSHYRAFKRYGKPELKRTGWSFNHPELCSIEGCGRKYDAKGFCAKHYQSLINSGFNSKQKCTVNGCDCGVYAKGFCRKHHARDLYRAKQPTRHNCIYPDCKKIVRNLENDFCSKHINRGLKGLAPYVHGNKGSYNHNWNGGVSEYPDHYTFKKNRLVVLANCNYKCDCGSPARVVHHLDGNKANHDIANLKAHCHKCHFKHHVVGKPKGSKNKDSKTIRQYGRTLTKIAKDTGYSYGYISSLHISKRLNDFLKYGAFVKRKISSIDAEYF